ncbi:hypothetical protein OH806_10285 [Chryseobacterium sp. WLa1L2M3]|uniref:FixH protein n=2 Tax=Chryseobacterium oryctis TaxID=2952618 RepID=A0ABT3HPN5_9FLAO|nr:hypothetical protein [Chryseobacterium oryctis]
MKSLYSYLLSMICIIFFLYSFQIRKGRHIYRNHWMIPAYQNLQLKNSSKENLEVVLYNSSQNSDMKYINGNNMMKVLPKNDSVKTTINFGNEFYVMNNSDEEREFRIKILNNSGKVKAFLKKNLPKN